MEEKHRHTHHTPPLSIRPTPDAILSSPDRTRLPDPTRSRRPRASPCQECPLRGSRTVKACVWFPRAVSLHGGLRVQRGRQWTSLSWWLCVCGRCLGAVRSHSLQGRERCEVNIKGNEVVAPCLTPVGERSNRVCLFLSFCPPAQCHVNDPGN